RVVADIERNVLEAFHRVYVCSDRERASLPPGPSSDGVRVLPNVLPDVPAPDPPPPGPAVSFLFGGTLAYPANAEAVHYLCREVLPALRARSRRAFRVTVVGGGATATLTALCGQAGVDLRGAVPDVSPYYRDAHAVIAP